MGYGDWGDNSPQQRGNGVLFVLVLLIIVFLLMSSAGGSISSKNGNNSNYTSYPKASQPDGYYSNPANYSNRASTNNLKEWGNGPYTDQLGNSIDLDWSRATERKSDGYGEHFIYNNTPYYMNRNGKLFILR